MNYSLITDIEIEGIDYKDFPDFSDAFISSAYYEGRPMTDKELDELNEDHDFVGEQVFNEIF
jgi:hypothetical protein